MWKPQRVSAVRRRLPPVCVSLTLLLATAVLVVLLPGAEVARPRQRLGSCSITLAESIPIGLTFNSSLELPTTYDAWKQLLGMAGTSVNIASYYWTLLGADVQPDPTADQGEDIFQRLMDTGLRSDIDMKIARNVISSVDYTSNDTQLLAAAGAAENTRADFVSTSSRTFFVTLGIDDGFLETDPAEWHDDPSYVPAAGKANGITVVNDFAERGVALMEVYNLTLAKDDDQRQYILQVRYLDFDRLVGAGILHTKMWVIDSKHFFVGSANTDWRSLTQVYWLVECHYGVE
ncbi:Phospholipase D3 [Amphibalanus amphitrite]|uniref:Phospholipase D3 n=1 Tax=Amphibalanus amphitrite TaxID=1232801 RepID=A0A6A4X0M8_AMPAM|nr:Phospholipase D3 [Amphibalanus amphitrite]